MVVFPSEFVSDDSACVDASVASVEAAAVVDAVSADDDPQPASIPPASSKDIVTDSTSFFFFILPSNLHDDWCFCYENHSNLHTLKQVYKYKKGGQIKLLAKLHENASHIYAIWLNKRVWSGWDVS